MIIRIQKKGNSMIIQTGMVFNNGIAINHTFKEKFKALKLKVDDRAVSNADKSILFCQAKDGSEIVLPFEFLLIDNDAFEKFEYNISGECQKFNKMPTGDMQIISNDEFTEEFIKFYAENTKEVLKLTDEEWNENRKDKEDEE